MGGAGRNNPSPEHWGPGAWGLTILSAPQGHISVRPPTSGHPPGSIPGRVLRASLLVLPVYPRASSPRRSLGAEGLASRPSCLQTPRAPELGRVYGAPAALVAACSTPQACVPGSRVFHTCLVPERLPQRV